MNWTQYVNLSHRTSPPAERIINRAFVTNPAAVNASSQIGEPEADEFSALSVALIHSALGLTSELCNELILANDKSQMLQEIGDACWFAAEGIFHLARFECNAPEPFGIPGATFRHVLDVSIIPPNRDPMLFKDLSRAGQGATDYDQTLVRLGAQSARFADVVKAFIFYGKSESNFDPESRDKSTMEPIRIVLFRQLGAIVGSLEELSNVVFEEEGGFGFVLQKNHDKLRARFPDKFDEVAALNRDEAKEQAVLEEKSGAASISAAQVKECDDRVRPVLGRSITSVVFDEHNFKEGRGIAGISGCNRGGDAFPEKSKADEKA